MVDRLTTCNNTSRDEWHQRNIGNGGFSNAILSIRGLATTLFQQKNRICKEKIIKQNLFTNNNNISQISAGKRWLMI